MAKPSFKKKLHYVLLHYFDVMHLFIFSIKAIMVGSPFPIDFPSNVVSKFELDYFFLLIFLNA
jgi:hypothetical protein